MVTVSAGLTEGSEQLEAQEQYFRDMGDANLFQRVTPVAAGEVIKRTGRFRGLEA